MADFVHVESPSTAFQQLSIQNDQDTSPNVQNPEPANHGLKFLDAHPFVRLTLVDKIYGCIIGSALGDTIGLYTEFLPKATCAEAYKERKFSLVGEVTEWYGDNHRSKLSHHGQTNTS